MTLRRSDLLGAAALAALAPGLLACTSETSPETAARRARYPETRNPEDRPSLMRELVGYAALAPSSHNSQCWKFRLQDRAIRIEADLTRRCPVVDPDDHHLFVSLGCATENLVQAAWPSGWKADARFDGTGDGAVAVGLERVRARLTPLFHAIAERQCTRSDYDGQPVSAEELRLLETAGSGPGVRTLLITERNAMERVLQYVTAGNSIQLTNPAYLEELTNWVRFGDHEAVTTGDGLFVAASGNPTMPRWLGRRAMDLFYTPRSENDRAARQIRSSAGIAVVVSDVDDKAHWVEAGRAYERFALQATALGIRNAFVNPPVEVASIRPQFASWLGVGPLRPDLVVRFGRGPTLPMSARRPVQSVIV